MTEQSTRDQRTSPAPQPSGTDWSDPQQPAEGGAGFDIVDALASADHLSRHPADLEEPSPVTSASDAELAAEPQTDIVDRGDVDSPDIAAAADVPNKGDGTEGYPDDAARAVQEPDAAEEPDHLAGVTDTGSGGLLPSDVLREPVLALLDAETTARFQARWQRLQLQFIDDPHTVTGQAGALVDEVVTALHEAVDRRRLALQDWQSGDGVDAHAGDTERLRVAVRRYRDFLGQLLGH
jgi:hypothetical protein